MRIKIRQKEITQYSPEADAEVQHTLPFIWITITLLTRHIYGYTGNPKKNAPDYFGDFSWIDATLLKCTSWKDKCNLSL